MATTYTTLFNLDVNKAIAQLKKFDRAKEKVLKSKAKNEFKFDVSKAIKQINKFDRARERVLKKGNKAKLDLDTSKATTQLKKFNKAKDKVLKDKTKAKLNLDTSKATTQLKKFDSARKKIIKDKSKAKLNIDTLKATTQLKKFDSARKKIIKDKTKARLNFDTSGARKSIKSLEKLSSNTGKQSGVSFGKLFTANLSSFLTGSAIIGVFDGLANSITDFGKGVFNTFTNVDEQMADIRKTTGLVGSELKEIQIDVFKKGRGTRTTNEDLLKIVEVGGRLGISEKKDLLPFVEGINKINVALGDEFVGGGDQAIETVGKLAGSFDELKGIPIDQSLDKIGSAINEVTSNSKSKGGNLSNFIGRIGQLPDAIKPSLASSVALGAVLEGANVSAEIAASGVSGVIKSASGNLGGFANQMGITNDEAKKLLNTDPGQFVVKFSESLKGLDGEELEGTLKTLKIGTMEGLKVVGALGSRTDEFGKLQGIANGQIQNATSLTDEYNVKNNTSLANIGKLTSMFSEFQLKVGKFGEAFANNLPFLDKLSGKLVEFANSVLDLDFEKAGADLGKKLNKALKSIKLDGLKNIFKDVKNVFKNIDFDGIKGIFDTIKSSLDSIDFNRLFKSLSEFAGDTLLLASKQVKDFTNILVGLAQQVDIQTFFEGLKVILEIYTNNILPALIPLFQSFFELSNAFFLAVASFGMPILNAVIGAFNFLATNVFPILAGVLTDTLLPSVNQLFSTWSTTFNNLLPILKLVGYVIGGVVVGAVGLLIAILVGLFVVFAKLVAVVLNIANVFGSVGNAITGFAINAVKSIGDFVAKAGEFFSNLVLDILGFLTNLVMDGDAKFIEFSTNSQNKIVEMSTGLGNTFTGLIDNIINLLSQLVFDSIAKIGEFASGMGEAFMNAKDTAIEALSSLPSDVVAVITNVASQALNSAKSIGVNIGEGMAQGIKSKVQQVANEAERMVTNALKAAKSALQIRSPSRRVRDEVGKNFVLGIPSSIVKYGAIAFKAVKNFSMNTLGTAKKVLSEDLNIGMSKIGNADIPRPASRLSNSNNQSNVTNNNQRSITQNNSITIQSNQPNDTGDAILQRLKLIST